MKKMLTTVSFRGLDNQDLRNLSSINGLLVDSTPISKGFYKVTVSYTPSKLDLKAKEEFLRFIGDYILSYHQ